MGMVLFSERKPKTPGWRACRTVDMEDDEFWFYFFGEGTWWSYGMFGSLKVRREVKSVVAWRPLTSGRT